MTKVILICLKQNLSVCVRYKEGRCVGLRQEGCMREGGGNCLKYLKREWNRKEEGKQNLVP